MSKLFEDIKDSSNLITGHINPDGDALGSALAFKLILDSKGIDSDISFDMKGNVPSNLNHLPIELILENPKENYENVYVFDCGNSERLGSLEEIALKSDQVIVIDHHMAEADLPVAKSIINPNRLDDDSELGELAAVGVCFLFLVALNRRLREIGWYNKGLMEPNLLKLLDLVALGTVCDVVPLRGLNRAFVSQGLKVIGNRSNLGLRILSDIAKIEKKSDAFLFP